MCPANKRRRYKVTSSLIGWTHTQNDPWVITQTMTQANDWPCVTPHDCSTANKLRLCNSLKITQISSNQHAYLKRSTFFFFFIFFILFLSSLCLHLLNSGVNDIEKYLFDHMTTQLFAEITKYTKIETQNIINPAEKLVIKQISCNSISHTVRCHYNAVNFLKNIHKRRPITRPIGRGMGCLF